jgi:sarcosine oxidase
MARSPDVAVVGGGIVGLAAAHALARRGADVVVLERGVPGAGQSAGVARGFRHLHATREQIAEAVRARAGWDAWSERAGEPLVGEEGALRLGGDVEADAARLRAAGVAAEVLARAGERHPALREDAGALLWDPRGGAIRAARTIDWLRRELGARIRRADVRAAAPGRLETDDGVVECGHVVLCAGAGTERLWPHVTMRRAVHLRVSFEMAGGAAAPAAVSSPAVAAAAPAAPSWGAATWADRSGRFGPPAYGVADGPGRFALGLADLDAQPAPDDRAAEAVPAGVDLGAVRERLHAYARAAFPGLGEPAGEVVRLLTVLPGDDEDAYVLERRAGVTVLAGHNLFKLAPLLGEAIADAVA